MTRGDKPLSCCARNAEEPSSSGGACCIVGSDGSNDCTRLHYNVTKNASLASYVLNQRCALPKGNTFMKQLAVIVVACLIIPVVSSPSRYSAQARTLQDKVVTLESLPMVNSAGVSIIGSGASGRYSGNIIQHGLQFTPVSYTHTEFHVNQQYTELAGTVYEDDTSQYSSIFTIYDSSDSAHKQILYTVSVNSALNAVGSKEKWSFKVSIRRANVIMLAMNYPGVLDVVATLTTASRPSAPPQRPCKWLHVTLQIMPAFLLIAKCLSAGTHSLEHPIICFTSGSLART